MGEKLEKQKNLFSKFCSTSTDKDCNFNRKTVSLPVSAWSSTLSNKSGAESYWTKEVPRGWKSNRPTSSSVMSSSIGASSSPTPSMLNTFSTSSTMSSYSSSFKDNFLLQMD